MILIIDITNIGYKGRISIIDTLTHALGDGNFGIQQIVAEKVTPSGYRRLIQFNSSYDGVEDVKPLGMGGARGHKLDIVKCIVRWNLVEDFRS